MERLAVDPLESISLVESDKSTYVSSLLSSGEKEQIHQVLLCNVDMFSWTHSDMVGVTPRPERMYGMCNRICTKGFLNYFSTIIEFLKFVLKVKL